MFRLSTSYGEPRRFCQAWLPILALIGAFLWLSACSGLPGDSLSDAALAVYLRANEEKLARPAGTDRTLVLFTIEPGESVASVARRLEAAGLITDAELFRRYLRYHRLDVGMQAGQFRLAPSMTMMEIALRLQHGRALGVLVTVPEGWRAGQIADALERSGVMNGQAFLRKVEAGVATAAALGDYPFLADLPAGASLEGYLFPDTYELPEQATPEDLIRRMLDNFDQKVTPLLASTPHPDELNAHQVLTLASIVEREAVIPEERPLIAGVYLNRLRRGMRLEADPTVQYAMGYQPATGQWWKTPVSLEEYAAVDSPYNTYLYPGLPPGPICNPGLDSIRAVLQPQESEFLYFVARGDGAHVFARTFEEHAQNVRRYLR
ncbi:MAG: endolytic transglycosylase MltG [Anaerolineae bacterium]|nr:endolytic transglycosylase MltG [Anaerolineae bacterium]